MQLKAVEFIRRFLLHVFPKGFIRIRHYGFLANRCKREKLEKCRKFLGETQPVQCAGNKTVREIMMEKTGEDITKCPVCKKGTLVIVSCITKHTGISPYDIIHRIRHNLIQRE